MVLAVGTRLQDFTTGSWTVFGNEEAVLVGVNACRFDAVKHRSLPVVGDARESLLELSTLLADWTAPAAWPERAGAEKAGYLDYVATIGQAEGHRPSAPDQPPVTYAQVVRAVNDQAGPGDVCLAAAGGFPGEVNNGLAGPGGWARSTVSTASPAWATRSREGGGQPWPTAPGAGPSGEGEVYVFVGDGSYLMMNSDLYSSVLSGHKMTVILWRQRRVRRDQPAPGQPGGQSVQTTS